MANVFTEASKTGDIVVQFPMASQVFKQYKIDFCCGGDRPIGEVLVEKELANEQILEKLNDLYTSSNIKRKFDWSTASLSKLVDFIVTNHHAYLNQVLPEISTLVTKVCHVHGKKHPELLEVYSLFHELKQEIEQHNKDEEEFIFPKIRAYDNENTQELLESVVRMINQLETEHEHVGSLLKRLRKATDDYKIPKDGCRTFQLTYCKLEELESDTFQHVHLENNILFSRLEKAL